MKSYLFCRKYNLEEIPENPNSLLKDRIKSFLRPGNTGNKNEAPITFNAVSINESIHQNVNLDYFSFEDVFYLISNKVQYQVI